MVFVAFDTAMEGLEDAASCGAMNERLYLEYAATLSQWYDDYNECSDEMDRQDRHVRLEIKRNLHTFSMLVEGMRRLKQCQDEHLRTTNQWKLSEPLTQTKQCMSGRVPRRDRVTAVWPFAHHPRRPDRAAPPWASSGRSAWPSKSAVTASY